MVDIPQTAPALLGTHDRRLTWFAAALAAAAIATTAAVVTTAPDLGNVWIVVCLAVIACVAERGTVRLGRDTEQSISFVPTLFAAVLFGPLPAMIVALASMIGEFTRVQTWRFEKPHLRLVIYTSSRLITGALAGAVAVGVGSMTAGLRDIALAAMLAALASEALDALVASITLQLRGRQQTVAVLRTVAPILALSAVLYTPIIALLAYTYRDVSPWTLPLLLVPALGVQRLFGLYQEQRELVDELAGANELLQRANLSFAAALVATLDARDRYTAGHSTAVAVYSRDIAKRMGLPPETQHLAYVCGLVHDIGKIGLSPGLLEKHGPLSLEERRQMQEHSTIGERILMKIDSYSDVAKVIRHHHERSDGNGYPDGLSGEQLPVLSRVIAVADAYNAMTSDRSYREAMPSRVARLRLAQAVGSQFDTSVVAAFEAILATAPESYRLGDGSEFRVDRPSAEDVERLIEVA